jgi:signal transduction histidine kinase
MKSLCDELSEHQEFQIEFLQEGFPVPLPKDVKLCIYRIAQESLRNVAKHSGARLVRVYLGKSDNAIRLSISDNGCGFDINSSTARKGLGLLSMRERLRLVGGALTIRSAPGSGTQIDVLVPVRASQELAVTASATGT